MALLETRDVSVRFGGVHAVQGASIDVEAGQLAGLIGPNGAGKTTFVDAVTGFVRSSGAIRLDGEDLVGLPPHDRARHGLIRTWQNAELFDDLSVEDNLRIVEERLTMRRFFRSIVLPTPRKPSGRVRDTLELLGIADLAKRMPFELSAGQRQLVGLGRALVGDAKVLLMDEPAAGLDNSETAHLKEHLRLVADRGVGVLLIEHDMELVLSTCDRLHVMDAGAVIATGEPGVIRQDPAVIAAYLGTEEVVSEAERPAATLATALDAGRLDSSTAHPSNGEEAVRL